jgi:hypothetical protein
LQLRHPVKDGLVRLFCPEFRRFLGPAVISSPSHHSFTTLIHE